MFKRILIPIALDHGIDLNETITIARRLLSPEGLITLVGVVEQIPSYVAEYVTVKPGHEVELGIRERLKAFAVGQKNLEVAVTSGKPGVVIADLAETTKADLIVIGSHKPGVEDYYLGSTASRVVRRAHCAVMVLR